MTSEKDNWQGDTQIIAFYQEKLVDEGLSEEEYEEMDSLMKSTGMRG